MKYQMEYN